MAYYHAANVDHGERFTFDAGGHYERVENGVPQQRIACGHFAGWELSDVEELAASKSPEAALFAKLKNMAEGSGNTATQPITIPIYRIQREPDADISDSVVGDFAMIEEVRYRDPSSDPVIGERTRLVTLPGHALGDVDLAYLPDGPHIISEWAEAVKQALKHAVDGGEYPDDVAEWSGTEAPDIAAYRG